MLSLIAFTGISFSWQDSFLYEFYNFIYRGTFPTVALLTFKILGWFLYLSLAVITDSLILEVSVLSADVLSIPKLDCSASLLL